MTFPIRTATAASRIDPAPRAGLRAGALYRVAAGLLAALPIVMVVATRSSLAMLVAAALAALAGTAFEGRLPALGSRLVALAGTEIGAAGLAFVLWSAASIAWSPFVGTSFHMLGEFLLPIAAAILLALTLPGRIDPGSWARIGAGAGLLAGLLLVLDAKSGLVMRDLLGMRSAIYVLNRPALTLLVLLPGLAMMLVGYRHGRTLAALLLVVMAAVAVSYSGAAKFGLMAATATFALAWLSRRFALGLVGVLLLGSIAVAPVLGDVAQRLLPPRLLQSLERAHAQDRVDIWRSFGAAVTVQPLAGAGFGTSGRFSETPVAELVRPEFRPLLVMGHPHNAPLQVWAELGAVGAFLAALVVALILRVLSALPMPRFAAGLALVGASLAVALVGQGAWQGWWPAALGASLVWLRLADTKKV